MTSVTSQARQYSQQKLRLKRWVFRRLQKSGSDCADVTWCGRLFQTREAATGKARSPYVDRCVRRTTRDGDEAERRRCGASTSAVRQRSSARYDSATLQTLVNEKGELTVNSLRYFEPVWLVSVHCYVLRPYVFISNLLHRWKRLCLVSWAAAPCVWRLRALTRNLLTYFLTFLLPFHISR